MDELIDKSKNLALELSSQRLEINNYKNEINIMMFPFCSTSKRKRTKPILFKSDDGVWLEVTANNTYGMAKIWDFDILRFVFSKISAIAKETSHYTQTVSFTAYECLKALNRDPRAGKNTKWLREALDRLTSTTYKGNVFGENSKKVTGFTLLRYEYEEVGNNIEKIVVTIDERLFSSIRDTNSLMLISPNLIRETAGIKKRLLELVEVHIRESGKWVIDLAVLQNLCANDWELSKFKYELSTYKELPWAIEFFNEGSKRYARFKKLESAHVCDVDRSSE